MAWVTNWRTSLWARWLGWTAVFALLFAGVMLPFAYHLGGDLLPGCMLLTLLAAFLIGVRFPYERWILGPPVAIIATLVTILILPEWGPANPGPMGNLTGKDELLFFLLWGGWIVFGLLALFYAALATAGVRSGLRRQDEAAYRDATCSNVGSHYG